MVVGTSESSSSIIDFCRTEILVREEHPVSYDLAQCCCLYVQAVGQHTHGFSHEFSHEFTHEFSHEIGAWIFVFLGVFSCAWISAWIFRKTAHEFRMDFAWIFWPQVKLLHARMDFSVALLRNRFVLVVEKPSFMQGSGVVGAYASGPGLNMSV